MKYKQLLFFDKHGNDLNLLYDEEKDCFEGSLFIPKVSVDLIESVQVFVVQKYNLNNTTSFGKPSKQLTDKILCFFEKETDEFFLFQFTENNGKYTIQKHKSLEIGLTGELELNKCLVLNIGFCPKEEDSFENILILEDGEGHEFLRLYLYGESEEEDERLKVLLDNLGWNISNEDFKIFQSSDINEDLPDKVLLNRKRKELLLEFHNIFNYLGSYKSLINVLKFFGYENIKLKEYWKNVNINSKNFGKYRHTDIIDLFSEGKGFDDLLILDKQYKKTGKFGLYYTITEWTGEYDEDGIPIVKESNEFTIEEVLIKLYALKNKLKNHFLPLNARIVDITGEALYFTKYDLNVWNDQTRVDSLQLNIEPDFSVYPDRYIYIQDLRPLQYTGCRVTRDLKMDGTHELKIYDLRVYHLMEGDLLVLKDKISGNEIKYRLKYNEQSKEALLSLKALIDGSRKVPFSKLDVVFIEELDGSYFLRIKERVSVVHDFEIRIEKGRNILQRQEPYFEFERVFVRADSLKDISDCFLAYFNHANRNIFDLSDGEDVPVGAPVILRNESFKITFEDLEQVNWNDLDAVEINVNSNLYNKKLFSLFVRSFSSLERQNGDYVPVRNVSDFPYSFYDSTANSVYCWEKIEHLDFYEVRWIIRFDGDREWVSDSGFQEIEKAKEYPVILPFKGTYTVELYLKDYSGGLSFKKEKGYIEADLKIPDFIGWYEKLESPYFWDKEKGKRQSLLSDNIRKEDNELTWDSYHSVWDLPYHPNEEIQLAEISFRSLSDLEILQDLGFKQTGDEKTKINPYVWNNLGNVAVWDDTYHLHWDRCNPVYSRFFIFDILSSRGKIILKHRVLGIESEFEFDLGSIQDKRERFIELTRQLNSVSLVTNRVLSGSGKRARNLFDDFIFYFRPVYKDAFSQESTEHGMEFTIMAVSKNQSVPENVFIEYENLIGSSKTEEYLVYGSDGDLYNGFEIYSFETGGTIKINDYKEFKIKQGVTDLKELSDLLNSSNEEGIKDFVYFAIKEYKDYIQKTDEEGDGILAGETGNTGGVSSSEGIYQKIIAVNRTYSSLDEVKIQYGKVSGSNYFKAITANPTWDSLRVLKYYEELPKLIRVVFTTGTNKMAGTKSVSWHLVNEDNPEVVNIYFKRKVFSYLFVVEGTYSLTLEVEDTNGNKNKITKRILKIK